MRNNNLNRMFSIIIALSWIIGLVAPTSALAAQTPEQAPAAQTTKQTPTVEAELQEQISTNPQVGYLIYFRDKADLSSAASMSWAEKGWFVMDSLKATAEQSQANVRAYLDAHHVQYKSFWIDNIMAVEASDLDTFTGLLDFSEIEILRARRTMGVIEPEVIPVIEETNAVEPNIAHVGAPDVWALGIYGTGMVVSSIDTGVRYTHDALVEQYRGNLGGDVFDHDYNWFDPYGDHPTSPGDDHGHGSHTMGTMLGDDGGANQIGMAPGAEWIACRGCNTNACTDAALLACAEFIAAPTDLEGDNPDPTKRPNAVNNSWGDCSQAYDPWYQDVVDSWHAGGIYPVFSNGNASNCGYPSPPGLNTVGNPARYGNVTGVGATGRDNGQYATFSNWGPTDNPDTVNPNPDDAFGAALKPQVAAPGTNIRSSVNTGDSDYQGGWSGTSMSAPHVTGLVALMWSAAPCLVGDYATTENIIENAATPIPYDTGGNPPPPEGDDPNYATGHGEINALAAVTEALGTCGDSTLSGVVSDAVTTDPIQGALVFATNGVDDRQTLTNEFGEYSMSLYAGTYTVTASAYGYLPTTFEGVEVSGVTTLDFVLEQAPSYTLSGVVSDATTFWPLYASVNIDGYPNNPIWTDPQTGFYSVSLPAGTSYHLTVDAFSSGYLPASVDTGELTGDLTVDVSLEIDQVACSAPGYYLEVTGVYEPFNATTVPAGWTVVNNGGTCIWQFSDPGGRGNLTGGSGNFAVADSDDCGSGTTMNTDLLSPIMDMSTLASLNLSFNYDYNNLSASEQAAVDLSADGGATWTNLFLWNSDQRGPAEYSQDVTAIAGGSTQVQLRFHYYAPGWDWWWEVDNVFMGEKACLPLEGGLVVGSVVDANDGTGLVGATVEVAGGGSVETVATPQDDGLADGFYTLFSAAGQASMTASMVDYSPATADVIVLANDTIRQDFALQTGHLVYTPEAVDVSLIGGEAMTTTMTLSNIGGGSAYFELFELNRGFIPFALPHKPYQPLLDPSLRGSTYAAAGSTTRSVPDPDYYQPNGDVLLAVDDGTTENALGLTAGGQFIWLNRFTPDSSLFPFTLDEITLLMNDSVPVGANLQLVIWEDTDGDGDPATGASLLYTQDVTVQNNNEVTWNVYPLTNPVFVGGPGDVLVGVVSRSGADSVGMYPAAFDANSTSQERSWVGIYSADPPDPPTLPPDYDFVLIDDIGYPGNWNLRASGYTGGGDVPWLSEDVITGTITPGDSQDVILTLDASGLYPGVYNAELSVANDTPYDVPNLPVQMTVSAPSTWGKLTGSVETTGYCDAEPAFLEGVDVIVNSAAFTQPVTLVTDASGVYSLWLDQSTSPLTVSVCPEGYACEEVTGVVIVGQQTTTVDFSLRWLQPCITTVPNYMTVNLNLGQSTTRNLRIDNNGGGDSTFVIIEQNISAPSEFVIPDNGPSVLLSASNAPIPAGHTEPYVPSGDIELSVDDGTQENAIGLTAGGQFVWLNRFTPNPDDFPFTLDQVSLLMQSSVPVGANLQLAIWEDTDEDGNPGTGANLLYTQDVTVLDNSGTAWNDFALTDPVALNGPGDVLVGVVNRAGADNAGQYPAALDQNPPSQVRSWIGAYSAGDAPNPPTLPADSLWGTIDSFGYPGNWTLRASGYTGTGMGGDVIWLTEVPTSGVVLSDDSAFSVVNFDANAVALPGEYKANLNIASLDPVNPTSKVLVTMNVNAPASWGVLQGVVQSLGYCDVNPSLAEGALVTAIDDLGQVRTATTNGDGEYTLWLNSTTNPHTVVFSFEGHEPVVVEDVMVPMSGEVLLLDADLISIEPCFGYTPNLIEVTVPWGGTTDELLTLSNTGAASTAFTITESGGNFTPMGALVNTFLVVNDGGSNTNPVNAFTTALANLGFTYAVVSSSSSTGIPKTLPELLAYKAVIYAGVPSTGAEQNHLIAYLDAGGRLVIADNDLGYSIRTSVFYQTYLEATYVADAGSDGVIVGTGIMSGITADISSDPYPDSFSIGPDALAIFNNTAPRLNLAGEMIERNAYKAIYFAWDYHYAGGSTVGDAIETTILDKALQWIAPYDVPWVSESPTSGTLDAVTGIQDVTVTFDANVEEVNQPGTYDALVKVKTQDLVYPEVTVPVIMHVQPSVAQGKIMGTVTSLGSCDLQNIPLNKADVIISTATGTIVAELETDANGYYQYWVDTTAGEYVIDVAYAEHIPVTVDQIFPDPSTPTTVDVGLRWLRPCMSTDPDSLSITLDMGAVMTQTFTLNNTGAADGNFNVGIGKGEFIPMAGEDVLVVNHGGFNTTAVNAFTTALTNLGRSYLVVNSSSSGIPADLNSYLVVIYAGSTYTGAVQNQLMAYLDAGGSLLIADNDLGYYQKTTVFYQQYLQAAYNVDAGSDGTLTGYDIMAGLSVNVSSDPYPDDYSLGPDALGIFQLTPGGSFWGGSLIERNGYTAIYLAWDYYYAGGSAVGDAIETEILARAMDVLFKSAPWLTAEPASGSVAADTGTQVITVTFDASVPEVDQPGLYVADVKVGNNDPVNSPLSVQTNMTVNAPASWGKLEGIVSGLGYCDADPAPLMEAAVTVVTSADITYTLETNGVGHYQIWMDAATNTPVTITVEASEHTSGLATGVELVAGTTTNQNFDLRWLVPCTGADPESLEVTLEAGETQTLPLVLENAGAAVTEFSIAERNGGFVPMVNLPAYIPPAVLAGSAQGLGEHAQANPKVPDLVSPMTQDTLLDQAPNQDNGLFADAGCDSCASGQQSIAENFSLPAGGVIGQIVFWTGYWPTDVPLDTDEITVIFHTDDGGVPGEAVYTEENIQYVREQTGVVLYGVHEWKHTLTLGSPLVLTPGNYWVEIFNDTSASPENFFWETGDLDPVAGLVGSAWVPETPGTYWNYDGTTELAIQLIEGALPIPWLSEAPITGTVEADSTFPVDVTFTPAITETPGTYTGTLRISNDDPVGGRIDVPVTMNVVAYAVELAVDADSKTGLPGESITYNVTITNTSAGVSDSFDLSLLPGYTFPSTLSMATTPVLDPGESATFQVTVIIPVDALDGAHDSVTVEAVFHGKPVHKASSVLTTNVGTVFDLELTPATDAKAGRPGTTVGYTLHVVNMGNIADTYMFSVTGNVWTVEFSVPSVTLESGESEDVDVMVTIPFNADLGSFDTAVIHATSQGMPAVSAETTLTTAVTWFEFFLPVVSRD